MTKAFRMRNKSKWGGVGMNLINPVTMDFLSSTLLGPALRQQRVSLARLHLTWLPAGLLGHEHSPCCGSDVRETTCTLSWVFFPFKWPATRFLWFLLPIPLLPSFSSDVFLIISSDTHLLKVNCLYHVENQFPLPTLVYVRESSKCHCYFFTDAQHGVIMS